MTRAAVIAIGAVSPLGRELDAYDVTARVPVVAIERDEALAAEGFQRPLVARVPDDCVALVEGTTDRAAELLQTALGDALAGADDALPGWRSRRIGIALGTSSGGMETAERFFDAIAAGHEVSPELAAAATYFGPMRAVLARARIAPRRVTQLVTACAASTWALGLGLLWLRRGEVDVVLAGGYDAHTRFVHAGFDAIRATSTKLPAPFRVGREGMSLGEGAGVAVLVREEDAPRGKAHPTAFFVSGFGASSDAVHVTAPDRTGGGLARAMRAAIADAGVAPDACAAVSAHATATPFNDAMEARAIHDVFGATEPVVHAFKAQVGHTLGAAGVLETLAIGHALSAGVLPATPGEGALDGDARVTLLESSASRDTTGAYALKVSAAFGGVNAALVIEPAGSNPRPRAPSSAHPVGVVGVRTISVADADLVARVTGLDRDAILRVDELSLLGLTAVAALVDALGVPVASLADAALVAGHALATLDVNQRFHARIRARGPGGAEPRVFPPTSPNLITGQISIHFRIRGPSAATCRGLDGGVEALEVAADLVAAGVVQRAVVVAVDVGGPASRALEASAFPSLFPGATITAGATAVLLSCDEGHPLLIRRVPGEVGHRGLARAVAPLLDT